MFLKLPLKRQDVKALYDTLLDNRKTKSPDFSGLSMLHRTTLDC